MPEGPLLVMWKEQTESFTGKQLTNIENYTKLDAERMKGKTIQAIKTWGKHFLICFRRFYPAHSLFNVWRFIYQPAKAT